MLVRFGLRCVVVLVLLLWGRMASANLMVTVNNVFGEEPPCGAGWQEYVVSIRNPSPHPVEGSIVVESKFSSEALIKAPFRVAGDTNVRVQVPVRSNGRVALSLWDSQGHHVFGPRDVSYREPEHLLLNATGDPRLTAAMLEKARRDPIPYSIRTSRVDQATGDVLLPEWSWTYSCVNLVVLRSEQLTRLQGNQLRALLDYVRIGGSLAIAVSRDLDVEHETLRTLAGGAIRSMEPNDGMWGQPCTIQSTLIRSFPVRSWLNRL